MITEKHDIFPNVGNEYTDRIEDGTLFFDIETTGFSPLTSHLYMIGISYYKDQKWQTIQWLDETGTADGEYRLITAFSEFAKDFRHCISYNGASFDFNFIEKKCEKLNLADPLTHLEHLDLYRALRPYRSAFGPGDMKQKSMEAYLGIKRNDKYTGGELIKVYADYVNTQSPHNRELLLCHNYDDITGMIKLLPLFSYLDVFNGHFEIKQIETDTANATIHLKLSSCILIPMSIKTSVFTFDMSAYEARFLIPCYTGTLKYFYPNYREYFYLPQEDEAVHKSLAIYVDKAHRVKANKNNCYTKKNGTFLPQISEWITPAYKENAVSDITYFDLDQLFQKEFGIRDYLLELLDSAFH